MTFRGILRHLDHVADLGVDVIWLSPVYRSPQDDNGYDISDYRDIDPVFGSLDDLDELITAVHARGMRLVMDLVVNHTSDEHSWFQDSRRSRSAEHADWYIWRDPRPGHQGGTPGAEPNNWGSIFSGPAWEWVPERGQYYLHLFSRKQPDLNWENPEVRQAVFAMMRWWLDRGVDGFRMDVVNLLSKHPDLPDGEVDETGFGDPMPYTSYGPRIHDHLAEMKREVFDGREDSLPDRRGDARGHAGAGPAVHRHRRRPGAHGLPVRARRTSTPTERSGTTSRSTCSTSSGRWAGGRARSASAAGTACTGTTTTSRGWSPAGATTATYWRESATALATVLHLHRGTPYVYQGEEIGMTNMPFSSIEEFRDIESVNHYRAATGLGADPEVGAGGAAGEEPRQRPHPDAVGRLPRCRVHRRHPVDRGEPQPHLAQRRRPAGSGTAASTSTTGP